MPGRQGGKGSAGAVQGKHRQRLSEVIRVVNNLFEGDAMAYVDTVLKAKMLESGTLKARAAATSRQQFNSSPGLGRELMNAIMDATTAHGETRTGK